MPVNDVLGGLRHLVPELALTFGFLLVLLWDLFSPRAVRAKGNAAIALLTLAVAAGDPLTRLAAGTVPSISIFSGQLAIDAYSDFFRVLFALITAIVVLMATVGPPEGFVADAGDKVLRNNSVVRNAHGELVALLLVVTLGMNLMAMARSLLMVYMGVEIVSVISFALAGFKFSDRKSSEGALKYVIFGGVASGIMLYGMSWLYGLTGSLNLGTIANQITVLTHEHAAAHMPHALFVAGICVLVGLGYKISAVPFHMWTPDVYEGSPTLITAFFSVGPKAAGFATLVRFLHEALRARSVVAGDLDGPWPFVIGLLALATMTVGNLMALRQTNVKRLLAFSGIGHVGYMLAALAVFSDAAVASVGFYLVAYCL
ncbi:NADH-quinone oxidoreductase subunit N, partial [Patescibacteria group bacterium]